MSRLFMSLAEMVKMINIICVRVGTKYGIEYVERLANMVHRHMPQVPYRITCLTDQPEKVPMVNMVDISKYGLDGWWSKMLLFNPSIRGCGRAIYFDLDTVICGDLTPLILYDGQFAICENFARLAGNESWPCSYGSCVMYLAPDFGRDIWHQFWNNKEWYISKCGKYGDQLAIEYIWPHADLLQEKLDEGYFLGYREFKESKPYNASILIFAGKNKPHNTKFEWVKELWL